MHDEDFIAPIARPMKASAAVTTSGRFGRMLPLVSMTRPTVTGTSSLAKWEMVWSFPSS